MHACAPKVDAAPLNLLGPVAIASIGCHFFTCASKALVCRYVFALCLETSVAVVGITAQIQSPPISMY